MATHRVTSALIVASASIALLTCPHQAHAAVNSKFTAWSDSWVNSAIPLQTGTLDVRQERQYPGICKTQAECEGLAAAAAAFAGQYRGHLYIFTDEPDQHGITPSQFAAWYHHYVQTILAADPTARFSPGGFTEPNVVGGPGALHFTAYADAFVAAYAAQFPAYTLRVDEYRFHVGLDRGWSALMDQAAAWSAAKGKPLVIGFGLFGRPPAENVLAELQAALNQVLNDSRIAGMAYWSYDHPGDAVHRLTDSAGNLTAEGVLYRSYAVGSPSPAKSGISAIGDFTHDGYADFADQWLGDGHFWVHANVHNNVNNQFSSSTWGEGMAAAGGNWEWLALDFTGDGWADYADVDGPSRQVWIHANLHNSSGFTFDWNACCYTQLTAGAAPGPASDVDILGGDFNGDGLADLAKRELSTGLLFVYINGINPSTGQRQFVLLPQAVARTRHGTDWRTIIGDFTGDGKADYADQHIPSGALFVHENTGGTQFRMDNVSRKNGNAAPVSGDWRTFAGDFTGDGRCDFADLHVPSGTFWVHRNIPGGGFDPPGTSWGIGYAAGGSSNWSILGSR
jgi:hypothetical protein